MGQAMIKKLTTLCLILGLLIQMSKAAPPELSEADLAKINQTYQNLVLNTMTKEGKALGKFASHKIEAKDIVRRFEDRRHCDVLLVSAPIKLWLDPKTLEILEFSNDILYEYAEDSKSKNLRPKPKFSATAAVQKAEEFLNALQVKIPPGFQLKSISYNTMASEGWMLRWEFERDGIGLNMDDGGEPYAFTVMLDEDCGLSLIGFPVSFPEITKQEEKFGRQEAILKAFDCVQYVMESSYFKKFRGEGYGIQMLARVEKKYAFPNWMLDPKRSTYMDMGKAPEETRLCWKLDLIVTDIAAAPSAPETARYPVIISIYLDITTGECVRANFR